MERSHNADNLHGLERRVRMTMRQLENLARKIASLPAPDHAALLIRLGELDDKRRAAKHARQRGDGAA